MDGHGSDGCEELGVDVFQRWRVDRDGNGGAWVGWEYRLIRSGGAFAFTLPSLRETSVHR
jgi:hypothetical protein